MDIDLQQRKIELIQWLSVVEDPTVLEKVAVLKQSEDSDFWNEISAAERNSIDLGVADANSGNLKPHSAARAIYEKSL